MKLLKYFLFALALLFAPALAHGQATAHVPTLGSDNVWTGLNVFPYTSLQLNTAPPPCPVGEYVLGIDSTLHPTVWHSRWGGSISSGSLPCGLSGRRDYSELVRRIRPNRRCIHQGSLLYPPIIGRHD